MHAPESHQIAEPAAIAQAALSVIRAAAALAVAAATAALLTKLGQMKHGQMKHDYLLQTLMNKFDRVEDLHQNYLESCGENNAMGIELFRQVKVLPASPPASSLPLARTDTYKLSNAPTGPALLRPRS